MDKSNEDFDILKAIQHEQLMDILDKLRNGEATPSLHSVIVNLLKHNGVEVVPEKNELMKDIITEVDFENYKKEDYL